MPGEREHAYYMQLLGYEDAVFREDPLQSSCSEHLASTPFFCRGCHFACWLLPAPATAGAHLGDSGSRSRD